MESLELLLHAGTLNYPPLAEHLKLAVNNGFDGISFRANEYFAAIESGKSPQEIQELFYECRFRPMDVDCVALELGSMHSGLEFFGSTEDQVLECAASLEARAVNLVMTKNEAESEEDQYFSKDATSGATISGVAVEAAVESAIRLADRADEYGLLVQLEPIPFMGIQDIWQALDLVALANRDNLGVQLDAWHFFRGQDPNLERFWEIANPEKIFSIQICDGGAPEGHPVKDTMERRLLPGEGDFDLNGLLKRLDEVGVSAPISLEVFSTELNKLAPDVVASMASQATQDVIWKIFE